MSREHWFANGALAALVLFAFADTAHDVLVLSVGAGLGYVFAYDLLRPLIRREP